MWAAMGKNAMEKAIAERNKANKRRKKNYKHDLIE